MSSSNFKLHELSYAQIEKATNNLGSVVSDYSSRLANGDSSEIAYEGNFQHHDPFEPQLHAKIFKFPEYKGDWQKHAKYLWKLRHDRLATLFGYCWEKDHRILIYRYQRGSLKSMLFHGSHQLSWSERFKIAKGAAEGLKFLLRHGKHSFDSDCVNTSNILIDYTGKAMLTVHFKPLDGECIPTGEANVVFRYGFVLMEILTATRFSGDDAILDWTVKHLRNAGKIRDIMDKKLEGQYSNVSAFVAATLAFKCLSKETDKIDDVIKELEALENFDIAFRASKSSAVKHMRSDR